MEITFQNKREDSEAFYDYAVRETEQGKAINRQALRTQQIVFILFAIFIGLLSWARTGNLKAPFVLAIFILAISEASFFVRAGFNPRFYYGKQVYKLQEKNLTSKDYQVYCLPRKITADADWLEISNSEAVHRWRWGQINRIGSSSNFIFIQAGNCHQIQVPKRDFPSELSFLEFGKKLVELYEQNKDRPIGAE